MMLAHRPGRPRQNPPSPAPGATASQMQAFTPQQNLLGTQITQGANPLQQQAESLQGTTLGTLGSLPNRQQLAEQSFQALEAASLPGTQQAMRDLGQRAASLGRIGSGMVTSEAGDIFRQRELGLANIRAQLAAQTAGQQLGDELSKLGGAQSVGGQQFGQQQALTEGLRGERGFQAGEEQRAINNALQQFLTQQGAQGQAFGQDLAQQQLLAGMGFGSVSPTELAIAQEYGDQAAATQAGITDLLGTLGQGAGTESEGARRLRRAQAIAGSPIMVE